MEFLAAALLFASSVLQPVSVLAQAGSRPAQYFDTPQMFYHSLNGSAPGPSGGMLQPVRPVGLLALGQETRFLLWVELAQGRLNVLENLGEAGVVIRKRIPVSIGKQGIGKQREGDNKTPIGVYRIDSFVGDDGLDDYYGVGAYPLNYPNPLDQLLSRTGHGIWLHGLPKREAQRPFLASEGCVVIDNRSLAALADEVGPGTTLVLSPYELKWVPYSQSQSRSRSLQDAIAAWRSAWEARDTPGYLAYYADDFSDLHRNKSAWADYKKKVNADKQFIHVEISDVSMVEEPAEPEVINVVYKQRYVSDNYHWQGRKQQLWRQGDDGWKIIFEGDYF